MTDILATARWVQYVEYNRYGVWDRNAILLCHLTEDGAREFIVSRGIPLYSAAGGNPQYVGGPNPSFTYNEARREFLQRREIVENG